MGFPSITSTPMDTRSIRRRLRIWVHPSSFYEEFQCTTLGANFADRFLHHASWQSDHRSQCKGRHGDIPRRHCSTAQTFSKEGETSLASVTGTRKSMGRAYQMSAELLQAALAKSTHRATQAASASAKRSNKRPWPTRNQTTATE
jgi:hypothetical protein